MKVLLLADGYEDAFMGMVEGWGPDGSQEAVSVYDKEKCIRILMDRDGMTLEDAIEFFEINTLGAYVGEGTPVYFTPIAMPDEEDYDV